MKPTLVLGGSCAALLLLAPPTWGADLPATDTRSSRPRDRDELHTTPATPVLGVLEKADEVIGEDIRDYQDEKLGEIKDLAIDLQNGRIAGIIVARGGFLGVNEALTALPPGVFLAGSTKDDWRVKIDKEQVNSASAVDFSQWIQFTGRERLVEIYRRFGLDPYFATNSQATFSTPPLGQVEPASKLIGMEVRNLQNEKLGQVENFVLDLPAGRIVAVILSSGGFLGIGDELSAVPPAALRINAEPSTLLLDVSKEALGQRPRFKSTDWPDFSNMKYLTSVYMSYRVEPYFKLDDAGNTTRNVRDRARPETSHPDEK